MNENDIHLKLLANVPIDIDGIGQFQLPTIREIISMGESQYHNYLSMLMFRKKMIENEDFDDFSDFEIMCMISYHSPFHYELLKDSYRLFFGKQIQVEKIDDMYFLYFDELSKENILTEEKWEYIKKIARMGNYLEDKKEEEYVAANEKARKLIEKIMNRKKQEVKKEEKINLRSILSAVSWRTHGIDSLLDKNIYYLYDGYFRLGHVDNFHYINTGIYTGNIDQSKIKLPDFNWANVINIK